MESVVVFFGGRSAEHDVSIVTALSSIIKPLELTKKYQVEAVYIAKDGSWYWDEQLKDITLFSSGKITDFLAKAPKAGLRFDNGVSLQKQAGIGGRIRSKKINIAFSALHGTYGEDGALPGLLDMAGIPYVGCGLSSSVLAMDKILAKVVAERGGIDVSQYVYFGKQDIEQDLEQVVKRVEKELKYPVFIKPARLGSSIGISKAADRTALKNGLEVAAHYDEKVLVEAAVQNLIEVTLPIIGSNAQPEPALLEQPLTNAEDFFDFDQKYIRAGGKKGGAKQSGGSKSAQGYSKIPADIPKELYDKALATGLDVFRVLGCDGIARVDMLIDEKSKKVYFNEVNPLPGSLYAHNWRQAGVSNVALVERLVGYAKQRHEARSALNTTFNTNFLQQF